MEVIVRIFEQRKYQIRSWMRTVVFQGKNKLSQSDVAIKVFMVTDSIQISHFAPLSCNSSSRIVNISTSC